MSDIALKTCFFCGETNIVVLEEHHIVSQATERELNKNGQTLGETRTVWLCRNCHKKLHYLYKIADELMQKVVQIQGLVEEEAKEPTEEDVLGEQLQKTLQLLSEAEAKTENGMVPKQEFVALLQKELELHYGEIERILTKLQKEGIIYSPREGYLKKT